MVSDISVLMIGIYSSTILQCVPGYNNDMGKWELSIINTLLTVHSKMSLIHFTSAWGQDIGDCFKYASNESSVGLGNIIFPRKFLEKTGITHHIFVKMLYHLLSECGTLWTFLWWSQYQKLFDCVQKLTCNLVGGVVKVKGQNIYFFQIPCT